MDKSFDEMKEILVNLTEEPNKDVLNQVSHDHRSFEHNLSNCEQKPEKVRTSMGFEPVTSRYRCDALTN